VKKWFGDNMMDWFFVVNRERRAIAQSIFLNVISSSNIGILFLLLSSNGKN